MAGGKPESKSYDFYLFYARHEKHEMHWCSFLQFVANTPDSVAFPVFGFLQAQNEVPQSPIP